METQNKKPHNQHTKTVLIKPYINHILQQLLDSWQTSDSEALVQLESSFQAPETSSYWIVLLWLQDLNERGESIQL